MATHHAPFTPDEITRINNYQTSGYHPFTCGSVDCRADLVATESGMLCPVCGYLQGWVHDWMATWDREDVNI